MGALLEITDKLAPRTPSQPSHAHTADEEDQDDMEDEVLDELPEEVKIAEQIGEFEEMVVWGHGGQVDEESDMFVRGMREWVGFAQAMHCDEEEGDAKAP